MRQCDAKGSFLRGNGLLEVEKLCKTYGEFIAVDGVDLRATEGMIFGLLGPNGAENQHRSTAFPTCYHQRPVTSGSPGSIL